MILVDVNLLLYAENDQSPFHQKAKPWWDAQLSGGDIVCLCWPVLSTFVRITTNVRIYTCPLSLDEAVDRIGSWLDQPCVRLVHPTERHWLFFREMLLAGNASANFVSDAHLAALAIEHGCELNSADADFARFPRLVWKNPLLEKKGRH